MKKLTLAIIAVFLTCATSNAQETFIPSGKAIVKVHSNFHYGSNEETGFEISRAYLGYQYKMSENLSGSLIIDVGKPEVSIGDSLSGGTSLEMTAYLKNASITYSSGKFSMDFGLISTKQFKVQEKMWGHRYVMKSFQDAYKMGSSADLGLTINYDFSDMFSIDLSFLNGEGYKYLQSDKYFRSAVGLTINPFKGFVLREYLDYRSGISSAQMTSATFVGYKMEKAAFGLEYNLQLNHKNMDDRELDGYSVYFSYDINSNYQLFGRYDVLGSNILAGATNPWNESKNGSAMVAGLQYSPFKYIHIALNYQAWMPELQTDDIAHFAFLNIETAF